MFNTPKIYIVLLGIVSFLTITSCADQYNIAGNSSIASLDGRMLYLKVSDGERTSAIDSSEVIHGRFNFMGMVDSIMMGALYMDNESVLPLVIENGNLTIKMDNTEQRVSGGPLNDRLYHFLARKNQLDSQYMELSYEEMRMMMKGCSPEFIRAKLAPRAEELSKAIEDMETSFIVANYDNVLGPSIFIMLCNQYQYPILTQQMKYILKKVPSSFTDHPYIKRYVKIAKRNSKLLNHHD